MLWCTCTQMHSAHTVICQILQLDNNISYLCVYFIHVKRLQCDCENSNFVPTLLLKHPFFIGTPCKLQKIVLILSNTNNISFYKNNAVYFSNPS